MPENNPETASNNAFKERSVTMVLKSLLPFLKPYSLRIGLALLCLVIAKLANLSLFGSLGMLGVF